MAAEWSLFRTWNWVLAGVAPPPAQVLAAGGWLSDADWVAAGIDLLRHPSVVPEVPDTCFRIVFAGN